MGEQLLGFKVDALVKSQKTLFLGRLRKKSAGKARKS